MNRLHKIVLVLLALLLAATGTHAQTDSQPPPVIYDGITFPELPYPSRWIEVNGAQMHYLEGGDPAGRPILFLHGQPTWSYLWRNVMPHLEPLGRVIAVDLIGMGRSGKPNIDYHFVDHQAYLEGFIEAMKLEDLVLVIHDWGSALGFDYAARHEDNVHAIAFMEALLGPVGSFEELSPPEFGELLQTFRTPGIGEELLINQNIFIEQVLPFGIMRTLNEDEMNAYRAPYPTPETRLPLFRWPNEVPIGGEPADVAEIVSNYGVWLTQTDVPMLHLYATPGMINPEATAVAYSRANIRNIQTLNVGEGLHFIQEDQPDAVGQGIAAWLNGLEG